MRHSTYREHNYRFGLQIFTLRSQGNLTQSRMANLLGVSRQAVVGWESGLNYPSTQHLLHFIEICLEYNLFHPGQEAEEIHELWNNANQHLPLDETWLAHLLRKPTEAPGSVAHKPPDRGMELPIAGPQVDWGDAPEVVGFFGREAELTRLTEWLREQNCRVVCLLGMGGIGKTMLAAKLVQEVKPGFERVYWRSLRDAPPPEEWLAGVIGFLSDQQVVPPETASERFTVLLQLLRAGRCLLVLDNFETLFEPAQEEGSYRAGLAGYGRLLSTLGESQHQSCLVLTTREVAPELAIMSSAKVRTFPLEGLKVEAAQQMLTPKQLVGSPEQWAELTGRFEGNCLALKLVGERIRELFGGEIGLYLQEAGSASVFGSIRQLIAEQVGRSTVPELQVARALAVAREPQRLADLLAALGARLGRDTVLEAVESLRRRSLVERTEAASGGLFNLQSVVLEYATERLVEVAAKEIETGQPVQLVEQPLIQATAKDYVRQSQELLIGMPILARLRAGRGQEGAEGQLFGLLEGWRGRPVEEQGYGPGNVINLLRLLRGDLRRLNLSSLAIRQAYLAEVEAQDASLAGVSLAEVVLAEAFTSPISAALSGDGTLLTVGTTTGEIWLWRVAERTLLEKLPGHTGQVFGLALAADGRLMASGGADGTVQIGDAATGRLLARFEGHTGTVTSVALSTDGRLLASGSYDETIRLWEVTSGQLLAVLRGHAGGVTGVALSTDGRLLASGSADRTVQLWETSTGRPLAALAGHESEVWGVALSGDGRLLASGGLEGKIRLWETETGKQLATLEGHTGGVLKVAFSTDGKLLASGGADGMVRLWEAPGGRPLATLQGHVGGIRGLALSADGHLVASTSIDGMVRLWEAPGGRPLATLRGHTDVLWRVALSGDGEFVASSGWDGMVRLWEVASGRLLAVLKGHTTGQAIVAFSGDGHLIASSGMDNTVRLWEAPSGRPLATLKSHTGEVWGVALSADGHLLASGGLDGYVRLWETSTRRQLATLEGHCCAVRVVALSADGHLLASGDADGILRLWETSSRRLLVTLQAHTGGVRGVALSGDGRLLASGGLEGKIRLWETDTGKQLAALEGHVGPIWGVALSMDGQLLASSSADGTVRLWETSSGRPLAILRGHTGPGPGVAIAADGHLVASAGFDGTVRLWDTNGGVELRTLRAERRYERLDITGLTGITAAQRAALLALGAVENEAGANPGPVPNLKRHILDQH
ncbi:MAG TPA: NACHT domain-containing protein [Anaerolineaceae bacterium]|nr:NACHT domain-containing protein [Anaerolineaceae bacterium]